MVAFASKSDSRYLNEEMRGYRVTQRWTLFDARLRDLDPWPLGQMFRMMTQYNMIAHFLVVFENKSDSKWRNERVPTVKNDIFSIFWLRDLDLWPLGQILRMVTQDVVIAYHLVAFASKSDSKWRNERVPIRDAEPWHFWSAPAPAPGKYSGSGSGSGSE